MDITFGAKLDLRFEELVEARIAMRSRLSDQKKREREGNECVAALKFASLAVRMKHTRLCT